jgi:hypothetical protein
MAASSLLALVNRLDESNKFNQLDEMQNHMSKLITEQKGKVMDDYVVEKEANKEDSEKKTSSANTDNLIDYSSSSEDKKKTPLKGLNEQKLYNMSSSDSDNK